MQQPGSQPQHTATKALTPVTTVHTPPSATPTVSAQSPPIAVVAKPAPEVPVENNPATAPATAAPTLQELLEKYVSVKPLSDPSSHFTHEGVCTKCGWHTMQLSESAAYALMRQHVQQHWRDIAPQVQR